MTRVIHQTALIFYKYHLPFRNREINSGDLRTHTHQLSLTMAAKSILAAVFLLLAVVAPPRSASAATYTVGDSIGWNIPSEPTSYSDWAATKTFLAGDILRESLNFKNKLKKKTINLFHQYLFN